MERRRYLTVLGALGAAGLAGCLADGAGSTDDKPGSNGDDTADTTPASNSDADIPVRSVIDSYFEAAAAEDTDALAEITHSASPLHPSHWGDGWEFQGDAYTGIEDFDTEIVTTDGTIDDIRKLENADFWFQETALDDLLGSEDIAIVDVTVDGLDEDGPERWVLVTDDETWTVFFRGVVDDTPANPEAVFEEPIRDDDNDVVKEIDWDYEQDGTAGQTDSDWARVTLTDSPGIEAETIRIESTIAGTELEFYSQREGELTSTWAGSWGAVELNPEGDQIVVTAVQNGTEEVVHRVHYLPEDG